jgi:tetratricopeptide (TPR) repeat protein
VFKMKLSATAGRVLFLCTVFTVPASADVGAEEFYDRGLFGVTELMATPEALLDADSGALFLLGSAELAEGYPELATHHLELLILNDPTDRRLEQSLFSVGQGYRATGRHAHAAASFRGVTRVTTDAKTRRLSLYYLGDSLYALGEYPAALRAYREIEREYEPSWKLYFALAQTQLQLDDLAGAEESLGRAVGLCDDPAWRGQISYWRGRALVALGDYTGAATAYNRSLADSPHGLEPEVLYERGLVLCTLGEYAEAADNLRDALGWEEFDPERDAVARYYLGYASYEAGEYAAAEAAAAGLEGDSRWGEAAGWLLAEAAYAGGDYAVGADAFARIAENGGEGADTARLKAGLCLYRQRDYPAAEGCFGALAGTGLAGLSAYWQGMAVLHQGRAPEAADLLETVAAGDGGLADDALLELARMDFRSGDDAGAVERFGELLERFPSSDVAPLALYGRAQAYVRSGEHERGQRDFAQVARLYPTDELADDALYLVAQAYFETGRYAEALPEFDRLLAAYPDSGYYDYARLRIADCRYGLGDYDQAYILYSNLVAQSRITEVVDDAAYGVELAAWKRGRYPDVAAATEAYLAVRPRSYLAPELTLMLARHRRDSGDLEGAIGLYGRILSDYAESPEAAEATRELARCYRRTGELDEALALLLEALDAGTSDPVRAGLHFEIAQIAREQGDYDRAILHYSSVVNGFPGSSSYVPALYELASCYKEIRRLSSARDILDRLLALDSGDGYRDRAYLLRAFVEQMDGREARAIEYYRLAAQSSNPDTRVQATFWLGECYFGVGQLDDALTTFQRVIDDYSDRYPSYAARSLLRRGQIYERRHQPVAARRQYVLLLRGDFPQSYRQEAEARLGELR